MRPALSDYQHLASGKVREIYRVDDEHLLLVATDRISAYDYVLDSTIPDKGRILTAMSVFFFGLVDAPNHLAGPPDDPRIPDEVLGRGLVVRRLDMLPVECVARGYLTGSGSAGLPGDRQGLRNRAAARFGRGRASSAEPLFTPATKAALGDHDENISFARVVEMVGGVRANQLRDRTLQVYVQAADHALTRGIIIADTKFEFGIERDGNLLLADEIFTPGLLAVLAGRGLPGRCGPDQFRQAVRPELAHQPRVRLGPSRLATSATAARMTSSTPLETVISMPTNGFPVCGSMTGSAHDGSTPVSPASGAYPCRPWPSGVETRREHHGDVFIDPYEWLRDKADPEVIAYLEAENDYVDRTTAHLEPLRQKIFDEIKSRTKETDLSVPTRRGDWWYYARTFEGKQYRVQCRCPATDPDDWNPPTLDENTEISGEQILLDSNTEAQGHEFFALGAATVKPRWKPAGILGRYRRR